MGAELSQVLLLVDRVGEAAALVERVGEDVRTAEQPVVSAWAARVRGELALRRNGTALDEAIAHYHTAFQDGRLFDLRPHVAHCHLALARLYRRAGKRDEAREHLTTATAIYRDTDMRFWIAQAEAEMRG